MTRGGQRVTSADSVSPDQSCLVGFGRAASLEHPRLWGGLADLSKGGGDEWSRLIDHLVAAPRARLLAKTKSRCGTKRSMFPGSLDARGSRSQHRWNYALTQRIW